MEARPPVGSAADRRSPIPVPTGPTTAADAAPPADLVTWAQFAAETERTPHPMDRRELQRRSRVAGVRVWSAPGRRGELVSRSDALELHRDLVTARARAGVA